MNALQLLQAQFDEEALSRTAVRRFRLAIACAPRLAVEARLGLVLVALLPVVQALGAGWSM